MLGLILGRSAGEAKLEPLPLTLPRFLAPFAALGSAFLSLSRLPGVVADIGDSIADGLATAEGGRAEEGVLSGPSFGVFRAVRRGVGSVDDEAD